MWYILIAIALILLSARIGYIDGASSQRRVTAEKMKEASFRLISRGKGEFIIWCDGDSFTVRGRGQRLDTDRSRCVLRNVKFGSTVEATTGQIGVRHVDKR